MLVRWKLKRCVGVITGKRRNLPVRSTIEGMIEGKRRRGRPRRRWITDIREWCDTSWSDIDKNVIDRVTWKSICSYMTNNQWHYYNVHFHGFRECGEYVLLLEHLLLPEGTIFLRTKLDFLRSCFYGAE